MTEPILAIEPPATWWSGGSTIDTISAWTRTVLLTIPTTTDASRHVPSLVFQNFETLMNLAFLALGPFGLQTTCVDAVSHIHKLEQDGAADVLHTYWAMVSQNGWSWRNTQPDKHEGWDSLHAIARGHVKQVHTQNSEGVETASADHQTRHLQRHSLSTVLLSWVEFAGTYSHGALGRSGVRLRSLAQLLQEQMDPVGGADLVADRKEESRICRKRAGKKKTGKAESTT